MRLQIVLVTIFTAGIAIADTNLIARIEALERQVAELRSELYQTNMSSRLSRLPSVSRPLLPGTSYISRLQMRRAMPPAKDAEDITALSRFEELAQSGSNDVIRAAALAERATAHAKSLAIKAAESRTAEWTRSSGTGTKARRYRYLISDDALYQVLWVEEYDAEGRLVKVGPEGEPVFVYQH